MIPPDPEIANYYGPNNNMWMGIFSLKVLKNSYPLLLDGTQYFCAEKWLVRWKIQK